MEKTSNKGTTTYQYDIYNRTRQVTTENGDIIKNKYDPLGFRYKKEVNEETHNYIFDGWSITAETNKDGELKSREVRGYGLVKKETNNKQYYYHQNEHGDITHLINIDEEIENSYQYDVFGNIREQQENVENVFKYAGEQQDQETEQYYLRARFYNPVIARFTQEDVYRGDGLNLYVYVVNNPLLWIDPSGYAKCSGSKKDDNFPKNKKRQQVEEVSINRRQALNQAKDLAGVPRSQQPVRQWVVGDDVTRKGFSNYVYSTNPSHHGRFYEYDTPQGKRVVVEHTNDTTQGLHTHAGAPKGGFQNMNYDFKEGKYQKINRKGADHHIRYK